MIQTPWKWLSECCKFLELSDIFFSFQISLVQSWLDAEMWNPRLWGVQCTESSVGNLLIRRMFSPGSPHNQQDVFVIKLVGIKCNVYDQELSE